jgi:hypothetical protein
LNGCGKERNGLIELILHKLILKIYDGKIENEKKDEAEIEIEDDDSDANLEEGVFMRYYGMQDNKLIDFLNE